ncbi:LacI family DNA-binding transcriptional regulator [Actinomyces faecalis]|uniref:LacI family DNA-binding transcriptional regulator n=1 Tax=Actinomyces faecalis TaxID=2722820 RepID=UPI001553744E|nr:LacI family DNA-binding transcriptional regulator [Actinomyces faecalis]
MPRSRRAVTIATVATRAGRSISTVSAALNNAPGVALTTRREILQVAAELGYEADPRARLMRASHAGIIGVSYFPGQAFQAELVDGLYRAAQVHGHGLGLAASTPRHAEAEGIRALVRNRCEAIIVVDSHLPHEQLREAAGAVPLLLLCRQSHAEGVDAVRSQDEVAVARLVEHVLSTGRREIVYVDGGAASSAQLRAQAYQQAMEARGMRAHVVPGGDNEEVGIRAVAALADCGGLPQALLLYNDRAALGALMELRRRGVRVPQEVAVAGFDGIEMTALSAVDLTTMRQDVDVITDVAVRHLIEQLGCEDPGWRTTVGQGVLRFAQAGGGSLFTVPAQLVVRGSTAVC